MPCFQLKFLLNNLSLNTFPGRGYVSACGSPLQSRGYDTHPAGSLLFCVREEPGELLTGQKIITHFQVNTEASCLGMLFHSNHFSGGLSIVTFLVKLEKKENISGFLVKGADVL